MEPHQRIAWFCDSCFGQFAASEVANQECPKCQERLSPFTHGARTPSDDDGDEYQIASVQAAQNIPLSMTACPACGFPKATSLTTCHNCQHDTRGISQAPVDEDDASGTAMSMLTLVCAVIWALTGFNCIVLVVLAFVLFLLGSFSALFNKDK